MKPHKTVAFVPVAFVLALGAAQAEPISDFSLFGGASTTVGSNVTVTGGLVGSNNSVSLGANVSTTGLLGGGNFSAGGNGIAVPTGNIFFNGNVTIPDNGAVSGNIQSGGSVTIGNNGTVAGSISAAAASGTAVTLGSNAQVGGTITHKATATTSFGPLSSHGGIVIGAPTPPFAGVILPGATSFSAGTTNVVKPGNTATTLLPSIYGGVDLGVNNVLNLSAGTYYFDTLAFGSNGVLNLDLTAGAILLYFSGGVNIGSNFIVNLLGGDASDIYAETLGDWLMADNVNWYGTIFGSGATSNVTVGKNHHLTGAAYARNNLQLDDNAVVNFVLLDIPRNPQVVATPATPLLLGLGLAALAAVRRRELSAKPRCAV